jgi:cytochrome b pre-mRNA-processing protein 3
LEQEKVLWLFVDYEGFRHMIYDTIIAQSRNPVFYTRMGVPDDLVGRYNMIVIHLSIFFASVKHLDEDDAAGLKQELFEKFMEEMESMVRDMGLNGEHVQSEVKNIAGVSSKQIMIYEYAAANGGKSGLAAEILSDFQKTHDNTRVNADALADYVLNSIAKVRAAPASSILAGEIEFAA